MQKFQWIRTPGVIRNNWWKSKIRERKNISALAGLKYKMKLYSITLSSGPSDVSPVLSTAGCCNLRIFAQVVSILLFSFFRWTCILFMIVLVTVQNFNIFRVKRWFFNTTIYNFCHKQSSIIVRKNMQCCGPRNNFFPSDSILKINRIWFTFFRLRTSNI